ncbi:universal stress protein [Streptomyces sp. SID13588]|uniref:universal stress protein n=1 Tax=Streptomyces sp. SID13588 TaxID=2706051 RepID=UPI0013CD077B|nr:universal stress protein [Streptomyces sp. SID13588]NEA70519.1 universal stress protein [Streptomyces sp. SID13588]
MPKQTQGPARRVVVGVDGPECSTSALRWAMAYAQLTDATVEAITTWQNPEMYTYSYGWVPGVIDLGDIAASIQKNLDEVVANESERLDRPVEVLARVVEGHPAEVLLAAAAGAQLLTVGTRGHGTFAGILLGSVSQHCVQHAPCPVVVVPE